MYQFSRAIYGELAPRIARREGDDEAYAAARHELLKACEATIERLATDHRYFAKPAKTLFTDVRDLFTLAEQVRVYMVIEHFIDRALEYIEAMPEGALTGEPRRCPASTRKGTACRREPRPGLEYCPSHRHLEDGFGAEHAEPLVAA
jgi:histone H3/H4